VHLEPITVSKDNGSTLEVSTGLERGDEIILDPADSLAEGQPVRIDQTGSAAR
jgi:hypothetical protein